MKAIPYWITSQLAIVPRPRGDDWLDDEMAALREACIDVVVSTLEQHEAEVLGLDREREAAEKAGLGFVHFPIPDRGVPQKRAEFEEFLERLEALLSDGKKVGVHCRACIGRSSVTAASLLMRSGALPDEVWLKITKARGVVVPDTYEQREWVEQNVSPVA
jgi:protein-tyrosine phosphatase